MKRSSGSVAELERLPGGCRSEQRQVRRRADLVPASAAAAAAATLCRGSHGSHSNAERVPCTSRGNEAICRQDSGMSHDLTRGGRSCDHSQQSERYGRFCIDLVVYIHEVGGGNVGVYIISSVYLMLTKMIHSMLVGTRTKLKAYLQANSAHRVTEPRARSDKMIEPQTYFDGNVFVVQQSRLSW